jgi:hypothetical protein
MPRVGFEPMIPVFERKKTVRALNSAAIGTGISWRIILKCILRNPWRNGLDSFCNIKFSFFTFKQLLTYCNVCNAASGRSRHEINSKRNRLRFVTVLFVRAEKRIDTLNNKMIPTCVRHISLPFVHGYFKICGQTIYKEGAVRSRHLLPEVDEEGPDILFFNSHVFTIN